MFIFYTLYIIIISLFSILGGLTVAGAMYLYIFTLVSLLLLISAFTATKYLFKKILLGSLYIPIMIYVIFKFSIFLTEYFDKFNPPF